MRKAHSMAMKRYWFAAAFSGAVIIVFAAITALQHSYVTACAELAAGAAVLAYTLLLRRGRVMAVAKYIESIAADDGGLSENMLLSVPLPMSVCGVDGTIKWYNDEFAEIFGAKQLPQAMPDDCIPELKWSEVLKTPNGKKIKTERNGRVYAVTWRILKDKADTSKTGDQYSVFIYLRDITDEKHLKDAYSNERIDIAVINIDNYDDFYQKADDEVVETASSKIRAAIAAWTKEADAVLKKTDRDRYFAVFEHQHLAKYVAKNFDIIKRVEQIAAEVKFPVTISIGIGTGSSVAENERYARQALDLALGRGGGQVCVKENDQFKFYGGKSGEYERSTRVKARAVAAALADYIKNSDNVIFMGHKAADFDCFGAAIGLQRAVREMGRSPYIVRERVAPAIDNMYNAIKSNPEYNGMFVNEDEVYEEVTENTLLVILDTHRPSMLPSPKLLQRVSKIVLIDHHRRSTEFISPCSLIYHEPYASSTCEMVTELIEYMGVGDSLKKQEAQCLYGGILLDTKNFMLKTGVRTFEAASYLRRMGLNTVEVRRMFCTTPKQYSIKAEIVKSAQPVTENTAVARIYTSDPNMRQIASQAADDMLNLNNVEASVVVYPADGGTGFSARSIGTLNVQLIMEKLGGGGHMTVSGAYIKGIGIDEGVKRAKDAILAYLDDIKTNE